MGYFGYWVVVRGARRGALKRLGLEPEREECAPGWMYAYGEGLPEADDFVERAARAGDGAAVGVWIFDDDYGAVIAVADDERVVVAIRPDLAAEPIEHEPGSFASWSRIAPHPLDARGVQDALEIDAVFAWECAEELLDRLGLPAPYDPRRTRATVESVGAAGFGG